MNTSKQQEMIQQITEEFLAKMDMPGKVTVIQTTTEEDSDNFKK